MTSVLRLFFKSKQQLAPRCESCPTATLYSFSLSTGFGQLLIKEKVSQTLLLKTNKHKTCSIEGGQNREIVFSLFCLVLFNRIQQ